MIVIDDPWQALASDLPERRPVKKRRKHRIACGRCGVPMHLHGTTYVCPTPNCRGRHKAHADGKPTGIPGDRETAKARLDAHYCFDRLWRSGRVSRPQAYVILRRIMGLTIDEAHIGRFSKKQCDFLIACIQELGDKVFEPPYNVQGFLQASNSH